jgi:hypothetical protein
MNETAARAATIKLTNGVMQEFIKDGGNKWADSLWKAASGPAQVNGLVDNFRVNQVSERIKHTECESEPLTFLCFQGDSKLSKICNSEH